MQRNSVIEYLDNFLRFGNEVAYVQPCGYRTARWSYREVAETAFRFARELEARQIGKGDRVLIWGQNSAEWAVAFLGCIVRGAVAVPMDRIAAPDFAQRVAQQVNAKLVVCSRDLAAAAKPYPIAVLETLTDDVARHSGDRYPSPALTRNDTVEIVFTSGTTAEPKGVVISHGNILANLAPLESEIAKYLKYERMFHPIRFLNLLPLSHVFGQFLGLFIPQLIGGTVLFSDTLNPSEVIRTVKRERVSVVVTVPRLLESLKEKIERDAGGPTAGRFQQDMQRAAGEHFLKRWWRFRRMHRQFGWKFWAFISGGAALDADTEEFWRRLGYVVIQGYGLTETTSLISVQHPFKMGKRSIGKALPGREIKLDPQTGEILVRGESIASNYWQGKELKPVAAEEGWFSTGDIGEMDADGNLYFKGRRKNVIVNAEGLKIYPEDLEAAVKRQPEVRDSVVVGVARGGNAEPCAVLLLRDPGADAASIVARANQELAGFQHMRRWYSWPEEDFPRTSTQKPRIADIQQRVQVELGGSAPGAGGPPAQLGTVADIIERITGRAVKSSAKSKLEDLGLSSIDRVELMSALEDRYQVGLDEAQFAAATTVGDVEDMLRAASSFPAEPAASQLSLADADQQVTAAAPYIYPRWAQRWPITWARTLIYYLLTWPATMMMSKPRVVGRANLTGVRGPLLMVCNHVTQVDIGYVQAALPARYRNRLAVAMRGEMLRAMRHPPREMNVLRRWLGKLDYCLVIALFNVFPLPQQSGFRRSFAYVGESADRGYSIVVFPEGRRTQTGELSPFRSGVGLLAQRLGLPVLPIKIEGLYELKIKRQHFSRPGTVTVKIGAPVTFPPDADPEQIAADLQQRVASL